MREHEAIVRYGKHNMYEVAAGGTRHTILQKIFISVKGVHCKIMIKSMV